MRVTSGLSFRNVVTVMIGALLLAFSGATPAHAADSCGFNQGALTMVMEVEAFYILQQTEGGSLELVRHPSSGDQPTSLPCGDATPANVTSINATGNTLSQGLYVPNFGAQMTIDMGGGEFDNFQTDASVATFGGANPIQGDIGNDNDVDMSISNVTLLVLVGSNEPDRISADGDPLTGFPVSQPVWMIGFAGNDLLVGGDGPDELLGVEGNDTLVGGIGDDKLGFLEAVAGQPGLEETGNDIFYGAEHRDTYVDGGGTDRVVFPGSDPIRASLNGAADDGPVGEATENIPSTIENIEGGSGNDILSGSNGKNRLTGGGGDDVLKGLGGNDVLLGGAGKNRLEGGAGKDVLRGGAAVDTLLGGDGDDTMSGFGGNDSFSGGGGSDKAFGSTGNDTAHMGGGNDRALGGDGRDKLYGEGGRDFLDGEAGSDLCKGGPGSDQIRRCEGRSSS